MTQSDSFYGDQPLVFAHRGANDMAPENTMAGFEVAIKVGADGIELDVMRCRTGEVVVIHDNTVDRTTNGSGLVGTISLDALRVLDAGSWFASEYDGQRIPTLEEVLDLVGRETGCIEIKSKGLRSDDVEEEIAAMIRDRGQEGNTVISSFNSMALARMRRAAPELQRALLYARELPFHLSRIWISCIKPHALHPHYSLVDEGYVRWAHGIGYRVNVWTMFRHGMGKARHNFRTRLCTLWRVAGSSL